MAGRPTGIEGAGPPPGGRAAGAVDPAFERSVRRWLWAYPRRWRLARADEVVGTLADLAGPGATALDRRSGLGLVVHGLATRRRMRPPFRFRMRYGWLNGTLPWQYRGWVADRIAGPFFNRGPLLGIAVYLLAFAALRVHNGDASPGELAWAGVYAVASFVTPRTRSRRQAAARHLVARPGEPPTPSDHRLVWIYRDRVTARSILPTVAAACGAVAVGAAALTAATASGRGAALAACLAVGVVAAGRLAVRWRRMVAARPAQPARRLLVAGPLWRAAVWCWSTFALVTAVPRATPGAGPGAGFAPIVLGGALVVLPSLVVAALLARRGPVDLAVVDVWRVFGAGPLPVDALQRGAVPVWQVPPAPTPT